MVAPSFDHERRLLFVESMADLLGCTTPTLLGGQCRPDVVRMDIHRGRLLVGDAKDTETPSRAATRRRFQRYAQAASAWGHVGFVVLFAICHDRRWEAERWVELLRDVVRQEPRLQPKVAGSACFDQDTTVTWLEAVAIANKPTSLNRHAVDS